MIVLKCQRRPVTGTEGRTFFFCFIPLLFIFFFHKQKIYLFLARKVDHAQISPFPEPCFIVELAIHSENLTAGVCIAVTNVLNVNYN